MKYFSALVRYIEFLIYVIHVMDSFPVAAWNVIYLKTNIFHEPVRGIKNSVYLNLL
jgi:hypothetical protein